MFCGGKIKKLFYIVSASVLLSSFMLACFTGFSCCDLAVKISGIVEDASGYGPAVNILNSINSDLAGDISGKGLPSEKRNHSKEKNSGTFILLLLQSLQACSDYRLILAFMVIMLSCCVGAAFMRNYKKTTDAVNIDDLSYYFRCIGIRTPKDSFLEVYRYNIGIGLGIKSGGVFATLKKPAFWFIENGMRAFFMQ